MLIYKTIITKNLLIDESTKVRKSGGNVTVTLKVYQDATIYTMDADDTVFQRGDLWVEDGKIVKVGQHTDIPSGAEVVDASGKIITPGLVDIHTHVAIWSEITEHINDANEYSEPYTPLMSALDGINVDHFSFDMAKKGGVTTVQTGAGSANPIGGVWTIIKTAGDRLEDMIVVEKSGLKGALGENPKNVFGQQYGKKPFTRMGVANIIRQGFKDAVALTEAERKEAVEKQTELAPFIEVLDGKMPLHLHCHRADDIATAIRIGKEFGVELHLEHCTEGHLMLDAIKESGAAVTLGPYMTPAFKYEVRHGTAKAPKLFADAGIPFSIMTDHPFTPINYLNICAAEAARHGLDEMHALRCITSQAAKQVDIDDRVGSLENEKDADFVIWSHHPFESKANVLETYIEGARVF